MCECAGVFLHGMLGRPKEGGIGLLAFRLYTLEVALTGTEIQICLYLFMLFPPPHFACSGTFLFTFQDSAQLSLP